MMSLLKLERKIIGSNILWVTLIVLGSYIAICMAGGDLVDWVYLGFEVLLPFYTALAVSEWVKTRSDSILEVIMVQAKSLFRWIMRRYLLVFAVSALLVVGGMLVLRLAVLDFSLSEVLLIYLSTAFCLSSLGVLSSLWSRQTHVATAICGVLWLFSLLARSLVRYKVVAYAYLFLRFAEPHNSLWLANKVTLLAVGVVIWLGIWDLCRRRRFEP